MCRRVWTSRETTPRHTNLLGFRRYSDASSVSPRGLMTGRTPYKRDARLTTTLQTQEPGRTQAPSYLYLSAVSVSNVSQSGLTSAPTALAHHIPLTIACPRASCGAPRTGSRHHPRALDISGGPKLPVCTVPLTCVRLGGGSPHASTPCTPAFTPCPPDRACNSSVHIHGDWVGFRLFDSGYHACVCSGCFRCCCMHADRHALVDMLC